MDLNYIRISAQTDQERTTFDMPVTLSSGVRYDHRKTLRMINAHKRGKFESETTDSDDIFWPLGMKEAPIFSAKLDLDSRVFRVEGRGDKNFYQSWATNVRFQKWAKDTKFAKDLDDIGDSCTDFGSVAIKLVDRDIQECDLMKLWFNPTIPSFFNQTKIELHELEEHEVDQMKGWAKKAAAWEIALFADDIETRKEDTTNTVALKKKFWERVGWFDVAQYTDEDMVNGEYLDEYQRDAEGEIIKDNKGNLLMNELPASKWKFMHVQFSGLGDNEVAVFAEEIKPEDDIYLDIHISKYEDRWMRVGVYERLFGLNKMTNELVNWNRQNQEISSLLLFKGGQEDLLGSNLIGEIESGTVIGDKDLEQIGISNTYVNEFVATLALYEKKADDLCALPDLAQLDQKTFRGLAAQLNVVNSAFKKSRDRIAGPVADLLVDRVLPAEVRKWNKEKALEIAGFEIDIRIYDSLAIVSHLDAYLDEKFKKGKNPSEAEKLAFTEDLINKIEREGRTLNFKEGFFDFKFGLGTNPTSENENKEQMNNVYDATISWLLTNPAVANIPVFREYVEKNGITPFHLSPQQIQEIQQGTVQGAPPQIGPKKDKLSAIIDS